MTLPLTDNGKGGCGPLDDPGTIVLGEGSGCTFLNSKHLDVVMQLPLPGIVIFVHGVNSDGEWYAQAEEGLCTGLNDRLKRCDEHLAYPTVEGGQVRPVRYMSELTDDGFLNPDRNTARFIEEGEHFSPVIQFRWGYKASASELQLFGNAVYLNEDNYWGGGPFANGCTALPDLWSAGLSDQLFLWLHIQHMNPTNDRQVYACPPRPYYVVAALRLAKLVESIRKKQADVPITIVCHSQGNMIGMAAAFLGDRLGSVTDAAGKTGRCVADNYVLCNPPYSLVKDNGAQDWVERNLVDPRGNCGRQTSEARIGTLRTFFEIVGRQKGAAQPVATIDRAMANKAHGFDAQSDRDRFGFGDARSTHGRVTLYFNPHDQVISASTIQGIGWRGLSQSEIDATHGAGVFSQRVFAQGFDVGKQGSYDMWKDQHNKPAAGTQAFWFPESPKARYSLSKGLEANASIVGKVFTIATAPFMYIVTALAGTRINAMPPKGWTTPLRAPELKPTFKPAAVRFGVASATFDQGIDMPGAYRARDRKREADDPYADDRAVEKQHLDYADGATTDAAQGDTASEAALKYEHHAMLRMQAKREGLYKNEAKVTEEDEPSTASAKYTAWRNEKIRDSLAKSIDTHATDHSTIMTNPAHARGALAYDVAIGVCRITEQDLRKLRIAADWRLTPDEAKNEGQELYKYFATGLIVDDSPLDWTSSPASPGRIPEKITNKR
jgi:pimeloyl-ACP methyl ester carboxylesterase